MNKKIMLNESDIPRQWYNITADMPNKPLPPLHPGTKQPVGPQDLAPLFPMELIKQEVSTERYIEIPDEIIEIYKMWRPSPLYRADKFEKLLDAPVKIYYKYEGVSPSGSHKPNTAVAQAYYNKKEGVKRIATETGAGQWGTALSFACAQFGLECDVYMVRISYDQKPYRKVMMNTFGANVYASPSNRTQAGRNILEQDPNSPGSLGIAISEAIEIAAQDPDTKYSLGSVLNHVLMHQTIIGQEAEKQMEYAGDFPDIIIAPLGGGSNFAGISFPFLKHKLTNGTKLRCIAVEPASCPKLTRGKFMYDFGDTAGYTPLLPMYTLGHNFKPAAIHAGGLRYHGASVLCSQLLKDGLIEAQAIQQLECFEAGVAFTKAEGIIPAPEATHGIAQVIREARRAKEEGTQKTILFNLCGHGLVDMQAYQDYFDGKLHDHSFSDEELQADLPNIAALQP
ncbi:MAG: tryptophan synthase subunit beta [Ignavibacteria bacterium]|nr:tryptophan synthase subunit beta [Ignavibacteria bacterium]